MNPMRVIALLAAVVVGVFVYRAERASSPSNAVSAMASRSAPAVTVEPTAGLIQPAANHAAPAAVAQLPGAGPPYHGVAIQIHSAHEAVPRCTRMLEEIAALGADTVLFSLDGFQKHVESTTISVDPHRMPSDDEWLALFRVAHNHEMRIVLMPKILLSDPRSNNWRGKIQPTSWDEWFDQYRRFVVRYARLAERGHVEVFIVGSELVSTEKYTSQWKAVIAAVRDVYSGRLSYSANWDHYRGIQYWDDLDLIGMTSYHKLSDAPSPSLASLQKRWREIRDRIVKWQRTIGRPLLFTEAGWCSQEGCSVEAWNYYRHEQATPAGLQEQRDCYQAFVDTWAEHSSVGGILWWEWSAADGGPSDFSYTPKNKPAERVLRDLFNRTSVSVPRSASTAGD